MKTLSLLRHAKSSWDDTSLDDFDRPLAPRGRKSAPRTGALIAARGLVPNLVICSGAARTRETLSLAMEGWSPTPDIVHEDALYHATVPTLLARLRALPDTKAHAMIVGHNPGLHSFALQMVGAGGRAALHDLAHGFPSGALAVITFDKPRWRDIGPGDGALTLFVSPKQLPEDV